MTDNDEEKSRIYRWSQDAVIFVLAAAIIVLMVAATIRLAAWILP